jgi:riboflavin kinase/FMN adenylyltransferase
VANTNGVLKIHNFPEGLQGINSPVVTVGTFDGVHLGHRYILLRLREIAAELGGETVLVTFDPHPRIALGKDVDRLRLLNTAEEKARILDSLGIDHLVVIPFTPSFSQQDEHTFVKKYLVDALGTKALVIGYNHRFGHGREGDFSSLKNFGIQYGFEVEEMEKKTVGSQGISSTQIRNALMAGDMAMANAMLGYAYPLEGTVAKGDQRGRELGFPTANLELKNPYKLIPPNGVYAVWVDVDGKRYGGMCNIGSRPTFKGVGERIEVNIFEFNKEIYHQTINIAFVDRLRDEQPFNSAQELIKQLKEDHTKAKHLLGGCS